MDKDSETYTLPEIKRANSILVEQMMIALDCERHSLEGLKDNAVQVLVDSSIGINTQLVVSAPTNLNDINLYIKSNQASLHWNVYRRHYVRMQDLSLSTAT